MSDVLVIGSLNVDTIASCARRPPDGGSEWTTRPNIRGHGGHAGNCAHAVAGAGRSAAVAARVGDDADGDELVAALAADGVDVSSVRQDGSLPTGHVTVLRLGDETSMVMDRGANDALSANDVAGALAAHRPRVAVLMDAPEQVFAQVASRDRGDALLVCAPGGYLARSPEVMAAARRADWLVLNEVERDLASAATDLPALGEHVGLIVTLGARGAELTVGGESERVGVPPEVVASPLGAGDAFIGGVAAGLVAGAAGAALLAAGHASALRVLGEETARETAASTGTRAN